MGYGDCLVTHLGYGVCLVQRILWENGLDNEFQIISLNQFLLTPSWIDFTREMSTEINSDCYLHNHPQHYWIRITTNNRMVIIK